MPVPALAELVARLFPAVGREQGDPGRGRDAQPLPGLLPPGRMVGPGHAVGDDGHGQVQVGLRQPRQPARRGDQGGVEAVNQPVLFLFDRVRVRIFPVAGQGAPAVRARSQSRG